ncbi:3'-5' exoribonuclease [Herbaspirillum sp. RV1423]|uniref:3'-5' exoribonuclease n=1 Tax=Herbaspirillum sp. RV1423 TaxID=1443993 RepID=UPI00054DCF47|nr:3'-5' exoribonuclease [Herbaspirillum sp. RV1423]
MLIFIDTEFTDFVDTELISIGLVTDSDEHEFYAELPVSRQKCSDFVIETVLPQLGKTPGSQCSSAELDVNLRSWLEQFRHHAEVTICFDFDGDWQLFQYALRGHVPGWLTCQNIYRDIDQAIVAQFLLDNHLLEHHALNDAKGNRYAYRVSSAEIAVTSKG